jgi:hypothetical protein
MDYGFDAYCDLRKESAPHGKVRAQAQGNVMSTGNVNLWASEHIPSITLASTKKARTMSSPKSEEQHDQRNGKLDGLSCKV